jgi:hypothetical protein
MLACTGISLYVLYVLTFVFYLPNCDAKRDRVSGVVGPAGPGRVREVCKLAQTAFCYGDWDLTWTIIPLTFP